VNPRIIVGAAAGVLIVILVLFTLTGTSVVSDVGGGFFSPSTQQVLPLEIELFDISILEVTEKEATLQIKFKVSNPNFKSVMLQHIKYSVYHNDARITTGGLGTTPEGFLASPNYFIILNERPTIIGEKNVEKAIQVVHPDVPTSNPLTACKAALKALGVKRVAFLTPYDPGITTTMRDNLLVSGFEIPVTGSFFESDDFVVGRIDPESILEAIEKIGARDDCDGVFVSCTNLRVASIIKTAEARLGKPVTSSNHALAWHLLRLAGIQDCPENFGSLFQVQLNEHDE